MGLGKILSYINWVDIVIVVLLFKITYDGFRRGLSGEIIPLAGIFIALVSSLHLYESFGYLIGGHTPLNNAWGLFLCFVVIGTGIQAFFLIIVKLLAGKIINVQVATLYDSILGVICGVIQGVLVVSFVLIAMRLLPVKYVRESVKDRSVFAARIIKTGMDAYRRTERFMGRD